MVNAVLKVAGGYLLTALREGLLELITVAAFFVVVWLLLSTLWNLMKLNMPLFKPVFDIIEKIVNGILNQLQEDVIDDINISS